MARRGAESERGGVGSAALDARGTKTNAPVIAGVWSAVAAALDLTMGIEEVTCELRRRLRDHEKQPAHEDKS